MWRVWRGKSLPEVVVRNITDRGRKLTGVFQTSIFPDESQSGLFGLQWIKEQMSYMCLCDQPYRQEGVLKRHLGLSYRCQTAETMAQKKLEFLSKSHPVRKKRLEAWCHPEEKVVSQGEISHSSGNQSHRLSRETEAETMMMEKTTPWLILLN